jgi:hypothetical protein
MTLTFRFKKCKSGRKRRAEGREIKGGPRLTVQRHREEPEADKLIEAHPIWLDIEWAFHYHLDFLKIRGFLNETYSDCLQIN